MQRGEGKEDAREIVQVGFPDRFEDALAPPCRVALEPSSGRAAEEQRRLAVHEVARAGAEPVPEPERAAQARPGALAARALAERHAVHRDAQLVAARARAPLDERERCRRRSRRGRRAGAVPSSPVAVAVGRGVPVRVRVRVGDACAERLEQVVLLLVEDAARRRRRRRRP